MATISTLLVDDNNDFLRAATDFLAMDGRLEVVGLARSGQEAIEQVALLAPALVLMDWAMHEMDGLTALLQLKQQTVPPCIIMLTQHDTAAYRTVAQESGADGFVSKSEFGARLFPLISSVCSFEGEDPEGSQDNASSLAAERERFKLDSVMDRGGTMQNQNDPLLGSIAAIEDEQAYLRLRGVILWLAESCASAVEMRSDLAPVLSAALQHAVAKLLMDGEADDLIALEAWLAEGSTTTDTLHERPRYPSHGAALDRMAA